MGSQFYSREVQGYALPTLLQSGQAWQGDVLCKMNFFHHWNLNICLNLHFNVNLYLITFINELPLILLLYFKVIFDKYMMTILRMSLTRIWFRFISVLFLDPDLLIQHPEPDTLLK